MDAGSGGRPGPDQVAGPERRKGADVVDQPREAPGQPVGAVLLPRVPVHTRNHMQRLGRIELVGGHDPWPDAAGAVKILALGDVERTVPQPVAHAALVAQGQPADEGERALPRDMPPLFADHQDHFSFVVELLGDLRAHNGLLGSDNGRGKPAEQVGVFRGLAVILVLRTAVGIIDADADVLLGRHDRRQHFNIFDLVIRRGVRDGARFGEGLSAEDIEQARVFRQPAAEIQDASTRNCTVAVAFIYAEACKAHGSPGPRDNVEPSLRGHVRLRYAGASPDIAARPHQARAEHNRSARRSSATDRCMMSAQRQGVRTMKSVPATVSGLNPWSEMITEAPTESSSEMRSLASGGTLTRSSASAALDGLPTDTSSALGSPKRLRLAGAVGTVTTFQRMLSSSLVSSAVKTCVPSGRSGSLKVTGALNTASKPLRTNSLPSLRLMKTEMGPGLSDRTSETPAAPDRGRRDFVRSKLS